MVLALGIAIILILVLVAPLFFYKGESLQEAASVNSVEKLEAIKNSLLNRYLEDERAHREKLISDGVWQRRKRFLTTRYIDASRRLDYLNYIKTLKK